MSAVANRTSDSVTICVLLYGDFAELAKRCLESIHRVLGADAVPNLRVGTNAIGPATQAYLHTLLDSGRLQPTNLYTSPENIHKYPMMRRLFYGERPITTPYVLWLDDDSYFRDTARGDVLQRGCQRLTAAAAVLGGAIYTQRLVGNQEAYIRSRPWYTGQPIQNPVTFVTGGGWLARMDFLRQHAYPWPDLDHRGGDVLLGALCQQQQARLLSWRDGLAINADAAGRESRSPKRGFDQAPLGADYVETPKLRKTGSHLPLDL